MESRSADATAMSQSGVLSDAEVRMMVAHEYNPRPSGRSPFEQLVDAVETHVVQEADALAAYRLLAETTPDPVVAMLMRLVLEDEERHHGLMQRIAADLRDGLYWTHATETLPDARIHPEIEGPRPLTELRNLIHEEQEGVRQMQELARKSARINEGLDSLLFEMMAIDSQKHERILRYVERRLASAAG
jgi:rubrerythrin